jgi:sialate O-acetylesterase
MTKPFDGLLNNPNRLVALLLTGASLCVPFQSLQAEVRLPRVFGAHMVLQQQKPIQIWGWAANHETVTVHLGSSSAQTQPNERGEWKVALPAMAAGGPYQLSITGSNAIELDDVMIGEVWLCSGQSNMEMGIRNVANGEKEIATANDPNIRLLMVPNRWSPQPQTDMNDTWKVCTPVAVSTGGWGGFSAAGYLFGRELQQKLGVPVGLIDATWGGTRIESWTPPEGFALAPALKLQYEAVELADVRSELHRSRLQRLITDTEHWLDSARLAMLERTNTPPMPSFPAELQPPHDVQQSTALYNGMIHPLCPFGIRGAIWYQGESNLGEGGLYTERMKALIGGWRTIWGEGEFPFYFVQIAPFNYGGDPERMGEFWEAQTAAQQVPHVGMAVINDIGNLKDIHPANKQDVAHRLALWALAKTYNQPNVEFSGPTFKSMTIEGNNLRITFAHAAGLASRDGKPLNWFEIIDAQEGGFVPAEARIEGESVVLSSPQVKTPVAMRFAWSMLAEPNLVNGAGLPAGAFRAGNAPSRDLLVLKVPEAKHYQLLYDLDLGKLGKTIKYDTDRRSVLEKPFDRIAYFLELEGNDGNKQFLYASMDAFSDSLERIGVPTADCGARFQQNVSNLNVYSNVKGIVTGTNLSGGNIEFWPNNYGPGNSAKVPHASGEVFDFGDEPTDPVEGYGSMQLHNHDAKQTLFAINHWSEGHRADLGIGNAPAGNPDWTFAGNAGSYTTKRLRVLIRLK